MNFAQRKSSQALQHEHHNTKLVKYIRISDEYSYESSRRRKIIFRQQIDYYQAIIINNRLVKKTDKKLQPPNVWTTLENTRIK